MVIAIARSEGTREVISIRRISLGGGYRYLMNSVAAGDGNPEPSKGLAYYYASTGTPPGVFLGRGLADLDDGRGVLRGSQVSEENLSNMLGACSDPVSGEPVGSRPRASAGGAPVAGFDLTFSLSKSVSVMWALGDDETRSPLSYSMSARPPFGADDPSIARSSRGR